MSDVLEGMDKNGDQLLTVQEYVGMSKSRDEVLSSKCRAE